MHAQYVPHGNIRDLHLVRRRGRDRFHTLYEVLWNPLRTMGYEALVLCDQVSGFHVADVGEGGARAAVEELLQGWPEFPGQTAAGQRQAVLHLLRDITDGWERQRDEQRHRLPPLRVALVIDHASRLPGRGNPSRPTPRNVGLLPRLPQTGRGRQGLPPRTGPPASQPEGTGPVQPGDLGSRRGSGTTELADRRQRADPARSPCPEPDADERGTMARLLHER